MTDSPPPPRPGAESNRFDPWAGNRYGGFRWFAVSTAAHVGLLFLFATITLTVLRKVEEIKVKVVDDTPAEIQEWEGQPSLRDLAGVLKPETARPARTTAPRGPVVQGAVRAPELPRIGGVGPKLGSGPTVDTLSASLAVGGGGAGAIGGLGGGFGDYVGGLRKVGLDVALVIDTTDSMQFVIDDVKARLAQLVASIQRMVPTSRVGIVVYRDKGDEYVVKWSDLSFNTRKLQEFLSNIRADGGGDWEEAVQEALETAINELKWRKQSKRIIILVGGSPPHPTEQEAVKRIVRDFRTQGGYVNTIDVTKRQHELFDRAMWRSFHGKEPYEPSPMPAFYGEVSRTYGEIAQAGGGESVSLDEHKALIRSVLELTFGARWRVEMAQYLKELT